ncbi:hypothetical protein E2C01_067360 [Portunus trituberculatus]|uniref:Uncharacterized protein n=1 Tax=Portunus trituberculatus TaxID=210409 RepID=A0A5B7HSE9_PORTR|nr:hypothetical protein [Portunus trituberculatus]
MGGSEDEAGQERRFIEYQMTHNHHHHHRRNKGSLPGTHVTSGNRSNYCLPPSYSRPAAVN